MVALPRLKTDLQVEARSDVHGAYYRLTSADGTRSHRLSQPAYMALSMLDGRFEWDQWSASVQTIYPQVTPAHMTDLLREVSAMGFLDGPLVLPGAPTATAPPPQPRPPAPPPALDPAALAPNPPPPAQPGAMMLSDLEAGFAESNVPLEVTGIRQALGSAPGEMPVGGPQSEAPLGSTAGAEVANAQMDPNAFDALFSSTDDAMSPQATQISAPPSEMEDPYLREFGPAAGPVNAEQKLAAALASVTGPPEPPPSTDLVNISLASSDLASSEEEPPAPPLEISNPNMVAPTPLPDPSLDEGMDVQFTDLALPALPRSDAPTFVGSPPTDVGVPELDPDGISVIEGLPVAMGMESTEGAPLFDPTQTSNSGLPTSSEAPFPGTGSDATLFPHSQASAASEDVRSDVSTTVVSTQPVDPQATVLTDHSQDAIPTATDVGKPIVGPPRAHPISGALPPFEFDPESNPKNLGPIPGPSGSSAAPPFGADTSLPSLEGPALEIGQALPAASGPDLPIDPPLAVPPEFTTQPAKEHDPFDTVESREKPRAHAELKGEPSGEVGLLSVTGPEGKTFQIYELEYQLMQLLDGERDLKELRETFARKGHPVDELQLASFIRQMNAYGFLASTGPIVPASSLPPQMPWKEGPPQQADAVDQWPAEERRLFQQGLTHFRDGNYGRAEGYFNALTEINADNPEALAMLALMKDGPNAVVVEEVEDERRGSSARTAFFLFLLVATVIAGAGMAIERPVSTTVELVIRAADAAPVTTAVDGVVAELMQTPGDVVKANAPLVRLAADDLLPEEAANKAELATVTKELELLGSSPEQRAAFLDDVRLRSKEFSVLQKKKRKLDKAARRGSRRARKNAADKAAAMTPKLDELKAALTAAQSKLATAKKGDDDTVVAAANTRLELARKTESRLQRARAARLIPAVFAGTLEKNIVAVGDALVAGGEVARMSRSGAFGAELLVPEGAMKLVEAGGIINARMSAFPDETYRAKVLKVGDEIEVVDSDRIVRVQVEIIDDTGRLKPKMSGNAAFEGMMMPVTIKVYKQMTGWLKLNFLL